MSARSPNVALFVTCLVDLMRPSVGFAAVKLLEDAGCAVSAPLAQTCCGQPAYNAGDREDARAIAGQVIGAFEGFDYVVAPSGSCAAMIRIHYAPLFAGEAGWAARAEALAGRTYELTQFLRDVLEVDGIAAHCQGLATYHDGCSGLRELGIKLQPRALLGGIGGLALRESPKAEACCGFGGTFCVKYPGISAHILDEKVDDIAATGADTVIAGDLGCLLNIAGRLKRRGLKVKARHVAEVLAGSTAAAIGEP
jgi:L-lactate dehydrogenase complex protein LldE